MASHIFVIGNGFDLNLGLKTSYQNFIASNYFQKHIGKGKQLFEYLNTKHELQKWVDIEHELGMFSYTQTHYRDYVLNEYNELCASLFEYISSLDFDSINKNSHAYSLLKDTCYGDNYFINFNYTNSIRYILDGIEVPNKINSGIYHVHGAVWQKNIVFGVDDKTEIYEKHSFLRKSSNSNFGGMNVHADFERASELTFFGHSLGSTDHMYFKEIFSYLANNFAGKKLNFYYYGEAGRHELHEQLHILTNGMVSNMKLKNLFHGIDTSK